MMWLNSGCKNLSKCFGLEMVVEKFDMIITENGNKKVSYKLIEIEIVSFFILFQIDVELEKLFRY